MFNTVTSWLGVGDNKGNKDSPEEENKENQSNSEGQVKNVDPQTKTTEESIESEETQHKDLSLDDAKLALEDVSSKAVNTAKEWGSYLYSFSKAAGKTVADHAKQITKTVEEKTFLGDFNKEQDKFVTENKEKTKHSEAAVPPWVGYNEEETMKAQILALSTDKRNFMRNPPSGVQFQFDFNTMSPIATATLLEDENLKIMRFELVPKQIKEEIFWRNYFYRVSLIKQSAQLSTMAQETGSTGESRSGSGSRRSSTGSIQNVDKDSQAKEKAQKEEEFVPGSPPPDNEFVSDTFQDNEISEEDLRKDLQQLGVDEDEKKDDDDNLPQWEKELQKELQEYEMVNDGLDADEDDIDIENEILQQIEEETNAM